jgi:hypothetical protein
MLRSESGHIDYICMLICTPRVCIEQKTKLRSCGRYLIHSTNRVVGDEPYQSLLVACQRPAGGAATAAITGYLYLICNIYNGVQIIEHIMARNIASYANMDVWIHSIRK